MKKNLLLIAVATMALASGARAEETAGTTNVRAQDVMPKEDIQQDIDKEITNAKMRASMGSKSKFSVKSSFNYNGSTVDRPFSEVRPDYQNSFNPSRDTPDLSAVSAAVGIKYSIDSRQSLTIGTGLAIRNPLQGDLSRSEFQDPRSTKPKSVNRSEVQNPYLDYTYASKLGGMQLITDATYSFYTSDISQKQYNGFGDLTLQEIMMGDLGTSGWSAGLAFAFVLPQWNGEPQGTLRQYDFALGAYPTLEYAFNDRYSFRTVFGYFGLTRLKPKVGEDPAAPVSDTPYQSVGLGIAVTRDIYLYPNVQFVPLDVRAERTNVALSANLNVF